MSKRNCVWVVEILQPGVKKWAIWDVSSHLLNRKVAKEELAFWKKYKKAGGCKFRLRKYESTDGGGV